MAVKLNLLPQDYIVNGTAATFLKIVKPANILLLTIFLVSALGVAGFFIFSSKTLNDLNSANSIIKNQIESQEVARQQVVLIKDRLVKINKVFAKSATFDNLKTVDPLINNLSDSTTVPELVLDTQKTDVSIGFNSNTELTNFVDLLADQSVFSAIIMDNFVYNPLSGYLIQLSFANKE